MRIIVVGIAWIGIFNFCLSAQVSPVPVTDQEVRDSTSTRMRSLEMERAKRNVSKTLRPEVSEEAQNRFSRIRDDFEAIQKVQLSIVEAYTAARVINYSRIRESALELKRRSLRLSVDFFNTNIEPGLDNNKETKLREGETFRDTLIELDTAVGTFVASPIFQHSVVDSRELEKAQLELTKIIILSGRLSQLADRPK